MHIFNLNVKYLIKNNNLVTVLILLALVSEIVLWILPMNWPYSFIRIEPIVYIVVLLILGKIPMPGAGTLLLELLFFVKLCVIPVIEELGGYFSPISKSIYLPYFVIACIAIAGEWVMIGTSIVIATRKGKYITKVEKICSKTNYKWSVLISITLLLFVAFCLAIQPTFINEFYFAWSNDTTSLVTNRRGIYYAFKWAIERGKPLFVFALVAYVEKSRYRYKNIILMIVTLVVGCIFTEYRIFSLITSVTLICWMLMKGKFRYSGMLIKMGVAFGIIGIVFLATMIKESDQNIANLSRLLDGYCGGYIITAGAWGCEIPNGFQSLVNTVWNGSFFLSNIFGKCYPVNDTWLYMYLNSGAYGSFYELSAEAKETVGLFTPFFIYLFISLIIYADIKAKSTYNVVHQLIYMYISISTSVFILMYTFSMIISHIIYYNLFFLAIIWIDENVKWPFPKLVIKRLRKK